MRQKRENAGKVPRQQPRRGKDDVRIGRRGRQKENLVGAIPDGQAHRFVPGTKHGRQPRRHAGVPLGGAVVPGPRDGRQDGLLPHPVPQPDVGVASRLGGQCWKPTAELG